MSLCKEKEERILVDGSDFTETVVKRTLDITWFHNSFHCDNIVVLVSDDWSSSLDSPIHASCPNQNSFLNMSELQELSLVVLKKHFQAVKLHL